MAGYIVDPYCFTSKWCWPFLILTYLRTRNKQANIFCCSFNWNSFGFINHFKTYFYLLQFSHKAHIVCFHRTYPDKLKNIYTYNASPHIYIDNKYLHIFLYEWNICRNVYKFLIVKYFILSGFSFLFFYFVHVFLFLLRNLIWRLYSTGLHQHLNYNE